MIYLSKDGQHFLSASRRSSPKLPVAKLPRNSLTKVIDYKRLRDTMLCAGSEKARSVSEDLLVAMFEKCFENTVGFVLSRCLPELFSRVSALCKNRPISKIVDADSPKLKKIIMRAVSKDGFKIVVNEFYSSLEHSKEVDSLQPEQVAGVSESIYEWYNTWCADAAEKSPGSSLSECIPCGCFLVPGFICNSIAVDIAAAHAASVLCDIIADAIAEAICSFCCNALGCDELSGEVINAVNAAFLYVKSIVQSDGPVHSSSGINVIDISAAQLNGAYFNTGVEVWRSLLSLACAMYSVDFRMKAEGKMTATAAPGDEDCPLFNVITSPCKNHEFIQDILVGRKLTGKQLLDFSEEYLLKYFGICLTQYDYDCACRRLEREGALDAVIVELMPDEYAGETGIEAYVKLIETYHTKMRKYSYAAMGFGKGRAKK